VGTSIVLGIAAIGMVQLQAKDVNLGSKLHIDKSPPHRQGQLGGYSSIVDKVAPSVVSIVASKRAETAQQPGMDMFPGFPFGGQWRPGSTPRNAPLQQGLGSGVIITADGYIVTNNHVVDKAEDVQVVLNDGRTKYPAKVIGSDPQTDLAILKVEADNLPPITIGDSSKVKQGDFVLAVGNPFGLDRTVTSGIVSAMGRNNLNIAGYENFIQTDASINPGNSGGALVDNRGNLIGINTAIFSKTGGNVGIGFAIPSNMVESISKQLANSGHVERGYLGVMLGELSPELAKAFGLDITDGILINEVMDDSPADEAGFKAGDVVVKVDGKPVQGMAELRLDVSRLAPESEVTFTVIRRGRERNLKTTIGRLGNKVASAGSSSGSQQSEFLDGVEVATLNSGIRRQLNIGSQVQGGIVTDIAPDSKAYDSGLRQGDVITQVNRESVASLDDAQKALHSVKRDAVLLQVKNARGSRFLAIQIS
jgi:serine protease Do